MTCTQHNTFADALLEPSITLQLYLGEDDDREFNEFDDPCAFSKTEPNKSGSTNLVVLISLEKYHSLFKPRRGALMLKLLGKNVSFRVVE